MGRWPPVDFWRASAPRFFTPALARAFSSCVSSRPFLPLSSWPVLDRRLVIPSHPIHSSSHPPLVFSPSRSAVSAMVDTQRFDWDSLHSLYPLIRDNLYLAKHSIWLPILHGLWYAFAFYKHTRTNPAARQPVLRGYVGYLCQAFGGGTLAAILLGRPVPTILNQTLIPLYTLGYLLVFHVPFTFKILRSLSPVTELFFDVVDAIGRTFSLTHMIDSLLDAPSSPVSGSILSVFILSVLQATGGGILYRWTNVSPFAYPGYDFNICCLSSLLYLVLRGGIDVTSIVALFGSAGIKDVPVAATLGAGFSWAEITSIASDTLKSIGFPVADFSDSDAKVVVVLFMMLGFFFRSKRHAVTGKRVATASASSSARVHSQSVSASASATTAASSSKPGSRSVPDAGMQSLGDDSSSTEPATTRNRHGQAPKAKSNEAQQRLDSKKK
ncbi:uncharacterized protein BJ171DRAFT_153736 [Polychytrium aggregatum]|uniref:uncharacterized protein n=1 Tax=Polychytrium aggregatum TaxID=110093 RepID=UPI0022FDF7C5|nr:uncharacterized protein BJ171DRAFT_153736 [Polychytrium aggregatum]KAI9203142.1 hypothetical protein BJ171DRAFT_153736 [Polychytrium aggregatum]